MATKEELIIIALKQQIAEMSADHAITVAMLRAELTQYVENNNNKTIAAEEYSNELAAKMSESM
jgi:hypothetical protein